MDRLTELASSLTLRSKLLSLEIPSVEELPVSSKERPSNFILKSGTIGTGRGIGRIGTIG